MSAIGVHGVSVTFPGRRGAVEAVRDVDLEVPDNEFACIVGGSGCGKSTLLNVIAGLVRPTRGHVSVGGRPVEGPGRDRGMVFQSYTLYEWLTVRRNVEFGLKLAGRPAAERCRVAGELLETFGLEGFEDHYPAALSGGMQQRVAIARALATEPEVLLMDEPFGALDALTRASMQEFLTSLWQAHARTIVFVTHDIEEALLLGSTIHVMEPRPGRVKAVVPVDLPRPRSLATTTEPRFSELKRTLLDLIFEPSISSMPTS